MQGRLCAHRQSTPDGMPSGARRLLDFNQQEQNTNQDGNGDGNGDDSNGTLCRPTQIACRPIYTYTGLPEVDWEIELPLGYSLCSCLPVSTMATTSVIVVKIMGRLSL